MSVSYSMFVSIVFFFALFTVTDAVQCPATVCTPATCTANQCNTVFGNNFQRRSTGKLCGQSGNIKCTDPTNNPSLGYASARAYWCGPGKTTADCGTTTIAGTAGVQFCQGSACLLVDGEYVWNCYEGHFLNKNQCSKCYTGQYRSDKDVVKGRSCKACSQGAYQDEEGGILCKACPKGYRVTSCDTNDQTAYAGWKPGEPAHTGCTSCQACPSGQYQEATGENMCKRCPSGTYGKATGVVGDSQTNACVTCPAGRWTGLNTGTTGMPFDSNLQADQQCLACPPGQFGEKDGKCQPCTALLGVTTTPGNAACMKCNLIQPGTKWQSATSCTPCGAGTQPKAPNYSECEGCVAGKHSPNGTPCSVCPAGKEPNTPGVKAITCDQCKAGQYQDGTMNACLDCGLGMLQSCTCISQNY